MPNLITFALLTLGSTSLVTGCAAEPKCPTGTVGEAGRRCILSTDLGSQPEIPRWADAFVAPDAIPSDAVGDLVPGDAPTASDEGLHDALDASLADVAADTPADAPSPDDTNIDPDTQPLDIPGPDTALDALAPDGDAADAEDAGSDADTDNHTGDVANDDGGDSASAADAVPPSAPGPSEPTKRILARGGSGPSTPRPSCPARSHARA